MAAPVESALATLLPTVSFLPPDLISLSNSLLAQSRAKAASLKPEEEIARTYVCCHIACDRLKKRLDLEVGKPTPPVKPRVYEKLLRYLDSVLTTPVTPRRERVKDAVGTKSLDRAANSRTRKRTIGEVADPVRTPTTSSKRARSEVDGEKSQDEDVPDFVMPMTRAMCKLTAMQSAVPHVLVGATCVVHEILSRNSRRAAVERPSKRRGRPPQSGNPSVADGGSEANKIAVSKWPALLVAVHILVAARMVGLDSEDDEIKTMGAKAAEAVRSFCVEREDELPMDIHASLGELEPDIAFNILEAEDYGWLNMEWYQNVPSGEGIPHDGDGPEDENVVEDEQDNVPASRAATYKTPLRRKEKHGGKVALDVQEDVRGAGLQPGFGTMFQPAIDWLSEERRQNYARWKDEIVQEMRIIETRG